MTLVGAGESYWVAHAMGVGPQLCPGTLGEILASSWAVSSHSQGFPSLHSLPGLGAPQMAALGHLLGALYCYQ